MSDDTHTNQPPTVVLVHGAFADGSSWNDVIERLRPVRRIIQRLLCETGTGTIADDLVAIAPAGPEAQADWTSLASPDTDLGDRELCDGDRRVLHCRDRISPHLGTLGGASMSAYVIANYRITNPDGYAEYPPQVLQSILSHGGEFLVADQQSEVLDGTGGNVTVVCRFASKEAAKAWYESDEYSQVRHYRTDNSEGFLALCDEVVLPR